MTTPGLRRLIWRGGADVPAGVMGTILTDGTPSGLTTGARSSATHSHTGTRPGERPIDHTCRSGASGRLRATHRGGAAARALRARFQATYRRTPHPRRRCNAHHNVSLKGPD